VFTQAIVLIIPYCGEGECGLSDHQPSEEETRRPIRRSMWRGLLKRCPNCGTGRIFDRYLKPANSCSNCGEAFGHIRTDDFAPWLTILLLGHILVPVVGTIDFMLAPPLWIILLCVVVIGIILTLALLPHSKGLCLGLMWALRLRGDEQH